MRQQQGQILIVALVIIGLVLLNSLLIIAGSMLFFQNTSFSVESNEAADLAEAGVDKALVSLNKTAGNYSGENDTILGQGAFSVTITTPQSGTRLVTSTGYVPSESNPKAKKTVTVTVSTGNGVSFSQAVLVGNGGLQMGNASVVTGSSGSGSVYSNGDVVMNNSAEVKGDLIVAGGVSPTADQQNDCDGTSCSDFIFGTTVNGQNIYDVAQSFIPSTTNILSKVSLKLKKFGSPPDLTVMILGDNSGSPNKSNVLASTTVAADLVTSTYSFVDASFSTPPPLSAGNTYWIVVTTSGSSNNYWSWQNDTSSSYFSGKPEWSNNWSAKNPVWNDIIGDLSFQTYMGGAPTYIQGSNGAYITGNAKANTISNLIVGKDAYYQNQSNITASGVSCSQSNSHCHPDSPDPGPVTMPISNAMVSSWENGASSAGVYNGDITSCKSTLPAGKYIGNVTFSNGCDVTLDSPIWITGNLDLGNNNTLTLNSTYGSTTGIIIVDGQTTITNSNIIQGDGQPNSEMILLSTYSSTTNDAVYINNGGNEAVIYAENGIVDVGNGNSFDQVTAWKIILENSVQISYNSGLSSLFVSSGPSGSFSIVKGTYQIK